MEQLFGLVIFLVIAGVSSLVSKAQEEAKRKKLEEEGPILRREDLPPASRRLYGDEPALPTAQPRRPPPARRVPPAPTGPPIAVPMPPRPQREARGDFDDMQSYDTRRSLEETATSFEDEPRPAPRPQAPPPQRRPAPPQPRPQAPQRYPQAQPRPQQPRPQPQARPQQQPRPQPAPAVAAQAAATSQRPPQVAVAATGDATVGVRALFASRDGIRQAILAQEILGPPRSMAPYEFR